MAPEEEEEAEEEAEEEDEDEATADRDGEPLLGEMTVPFFSLRTSSTRNSTMRGRNDDEGEAAAAAAAEEEEEEEEAGNPGVGAVEVECPEMVDENEAGGGLTW